MDKFTIQSSQNAIRKRQSKRTDDMATNVITVIIALACIAIIFITLLQYFK